MTSIVVGISDQLDNLSIEKKEEVQIAEGVGEVACENHHGICAICLNKIVLQETALVKGCEHAYCVTCILRWASYKEKTTCPQCKHPFESLNVHRSLDGSLHDYMYEESVCLLLRASWFLPLVVDHHEEPDEEVFDYSLYEDQHPYQYQYQYNEDDDDELNEMYLNRSPNLRIGNRRWGDNGYVRAGRQEARPAVSRQESSAGSSRERKKKEKAVVKDAAVGRRAKRALKREAADKAAGTCKA